MLGLGAGVIVLNFLFLRRTIGVQKEILLANEEYSLNCSNAIHGKMSVRQYSAKRMMTDGRGAGKEEPFPADCSVSFEQVSVSYGGHPVLKNAPIVIFDEPTAALDSKSEAQILDTVRSLKLEGKCVLMITHKESTLRAGDRILRIENKEVTELPAYRTQQR